MSRNLTKYTLTTPNATCNDGSPVALADALDAFAFGAPPPPLLVENCTGFACGVDCRPV